MNVEKLSDLALAYLPLIDDKRKCKHVSIITYKNNFVTAGVNQMKTHPLAREYKYRFDEVHSELDAWLKIRDKNKPYSLVNFRFGHNDEMRMARPCKLCMPWCKQIFKSIYYSTKHGIVREVY